MIKSWLFAPSTIAIGGNITYSGDYKIHTFPSSGSFIVTLGISCEILIVAGGGGGGGSVYGCGGAGAGGILHGTKVLGSDSYNVIIGAGGVGGYPYGNVGNDSFLGDHRAFGGGWTSAALDPTTARDGGCGAGQMHNYSATGGASIQTSNNGLIGYGNKGGNGVYVDPYWMGSGGGVGAAGTTSGAGGAGKAFTIYNGSSIYYAGGGGQCNNSGGWTGGGIGGGGSGTPSGKAGSGTPNTGGGGGSSKGTGGGGNGGSGIVIVRYKYK